MAEPLVHIQVGKVLDDGRWWVYDRVDGVETDHCPTGAREVAASIRADKDRTADLLEVADTYERIADEVEALNKMSVSETET